MEIVRFVSHLPAFVRLFLRLLGDSRVGVFAKALLVSGVVYALTPLDFLPDLLPMLGQVDDLAIFAMACKIFLQLCPLPVVREHAAAIDRTGKWSPVGES